MSESIIDPRSLIKGEIKKIRLSPKLQAYYNVWKEMLKEQNKSPSELDVFYFGYLLSNPSFREQLRTL